MWPEGSWLPWRGFQGALLFSKKVKKELPPVLPLNTKLPVTVTYRDDCYLLGGGGVGIHPLFTGKMQNAGKEQRGKDQG